MTAPPEYRIQEAVDSFCERLICDCRGPDAARKYLENEEVDTRKHRQRAQVVCRRLLAGRRGVLGPDNVQQPGERYVKETLIWPILDALGYEYRIESYLGTTDNRADFRVVNLPVDVLGECKAPNDYRKAVQDFRDDLDANGVNAEFGLITDGFNWQLVHTNYPTDRPNIISEYDLRSLVASRIKMKGARNPHQAVRDVGGDASVHTRGRHESDSTVVANEFVARFQRQSVVENINAHEV